MTKRMLIDATHAEETRVVVMDGNRLDDFDVETASKKQLKGNIYLAKVVRVEPSLQAAFVEYGGNRHGFLAFSEIHPDYYQIPVADRQRLLQMQEDEAREEEEAEDDDFVLPSDTAARGGQHEHRAPPPEAVTEGPELAGDALPADAPANQAAAESPEDAAERSQALEIHQDVIRAEATPDAEAPAGAAPAGVALGADMVPEAATPAEAEAASAAYRDDDERYAERRDSDQAGDAGPAGQDDAHGLDVPGRDDHGQDDSGADDHGSGHHDYGHIDSVPADAPPPETVGGGSENEEPRERRMPPRFMRNYKIQEVIRRRQIMLIQVVKEERGTKGAALTTYISLAGRYSVLMPNSPRGGGISRKITSSADRKRLKEVMVELDIPKGMGLIVRTAGAQRPKPEIKRDCEYLLRLWDDIREHTLRSVAPALIYEEASLIKRAIRDVYSRDLDEVLVDGEEGWKAARDFMRMLMPAHARRVQLWKDGGTKLFAANQVEAQLDAMLSPVVQLRSGGYLVINQAEALVAIDVNSGRATRERNIEETALRTNLEAAEEVARQLRLRDLAGLIVIDFIDMESKKNNAAVERKLKEALKVDRARIQVGHISHFGLMEMSRQRLRPSLAETSFVTCPHCAGTGHVRSTDSAAMHVLRQVEEEGGKRRAAEIVVHVASTIALYILNHKRAWLAEIEQRYAMHVAFNADDTLLPPNIRIERLRAAVPSEITAISQDSTRSLPQVAYEAEDEVEEEPDVDVEDEVDPVEAEEAIPGMGPQPEIRPVGAPPAVPQTAAEREEGERRRRRRRRRRRGRREDGSLPGQPLANGEDAGDDGDEGDEGEAESFADAETTGADAGMPLDPDSGAETGALDGSHMILEPGSEALAAAPASGRDPIGEAIASELGAAPTADLGETVAAEIGEAIAAEIGGGESPGAEAAPEEGGERRGRGRRGGRRRRRPAEEDVLPPPLPHIGPTPADPFAGQAFDIFDIIEAQAANEAAEAAQRAAPRAVAPAVQIPIAQGPVAPAVPPAASVESDSPVPESAASATPQPETATRQETADSALPAGVDSAPAAAPEASAPAGESVTAPAAEPAMPEMASPEAAVPELAAPPPAAPAIAEPPEPQAAVDEAATAEAATAAPATAEEPAPEAPAIRPVMIDAPPPEPARKRGWWRRS